LEFHKSILMAIFRGGHRSVSEKVGRNFF
jgi:hypothetical protein